MHKKMLRRAMFLPALMALLLTAPLVPLPSTDKADTPAQVQGLANQATKINRNVMVDGKRYTEYMLTHTGGPNDHHAYAVAEGGSTLHYWDPPGAEPNQQWWLDATLSVLHREDCSVHQFPCDQYYRASFKMNSMKGLFSDDDDIYVPPGDYAPTDFQRVRIGLVKRNLSLSTVTPLGHDGWFTQGDGWSYGCWGTGREFKVGESFDDVIMVDAWVWRQAKSFDPTTGWRSDPYNQGYHQTRSKELALDGLTPHGQQDNFMSGVWLRPPGGDTSAPNAVLRGYCPAWTPAP